MDNQCLACIANGTTGINNNFYNALLDRIRAHIADLYRTAFNYKAGFLDPVEWRPREFNKAADYVANCVLHKNCDVDNITVSAAVGAVTDAIAIQIFSDGGYNFGKGAAAFVVTCVRWDGQQLHSELLGGRGILIKEARSAFHTEVTALDMAVQFMLEFVAHL